MKLELRESNSQYWLIGTTKNKRLAGSDFNLACYYNSKKKQYELADAMMQKGKGIENVYLITGYEWDNMPSDGRESFGYLKNKGTLIKSINTVTPYEAKYGAKTECDYPKGVSRDPLPKKGAKIYTSPATALEKQEPKFKPELKETAVSEDDMINMLQDILDQSNGYDVNKTPTAAGLYIVVLDIHGEKYWFKYDEQAKACSEDYKRLLDTVNTTKTNIGEIRKSIITTDGTEDVLWQDYPDTKYEEAEIKTEAVPWKAIATGAMYAVDNWDTLKDMIETIKETSADVYNKVITIFNYLKGKNANPKDAAKDIANMVAAEESLTEGATKLEKGEGSTFENAGETWKVIKQNAEDTLVVALDKDGNEKDRYVVAWGLQKDNSWNQGHYFTDRNEAMKYFNKREKKQESLKESNNNEYSVKYNVGDVVKFIHAGNKESDETATITGYDNEGFYKVKWSDGEESEGLHDKNLKLVSKSDLKESKIVTPVGNPQTAGSFVNIDVDLDHMEVSDFIVRLAQAIRSEQTAVLEYVALTSANGITNEDRNVIEGIMKEEKNHMCALTALLYKQILMNHKENVDEANDEFTLPKFGADIFDENNKLTESISIILNKIITESGHDGTNDEYTVGDRESARIYNGLSNTLNVIKNIISTSGEEVVVQNVTLSDNSKIVKEANTMTAEEISQIDVSKIQPTQKDFDRADGLLFRGHTFRGDNLPWASEANKMAKLIKDPIKLIRRAKAVYAAYGDKYSPRVNNTGYYITNYQEDGDKEVDVWTPFNDALKRMGFTIDQIKILKDTSKDLKESLKESTMTIDDLINELKTDTNYDEIAYHIHEYSKADKNKAMELMDLLFELEDNKSPKECRDEIINRLMVTEAVNTTSKGDTFEITADAEYDSDNAQKVFDNLKRAANKLNKSNSKKYSIQVDSIKVQEGKLTFKLDNKSDSLSDDELEKIVNNLAKEASTYDAFIKIK